MIVLKDMCCDRKKSDKIKLDKDEEHEIEDLFNNNTKMAPIEDKFYKQTLAQSGLSKRAVQRLKIEFRFIKYVNNLLQQNQLDHAMTII